MFNSHGILGQNARNLDYIKWYNTKFARNLADSKLKTKDFLQTKKVAVPKTLAILKGHHEIKLDEIAAWEPPFVVKPNSGYGGKGIIVIDSVDSAGNFISNTGQAYSPAQMFSHLSYIVDGFYSLSGLRDKAMIEKKIVLDEEIELFGKYGLPDIRVICFNNVPIMAMIRIPTAKSEWKANLHLGACAAGIDIGTGKLTYITQNSKIIKTVPGIGDIRGIKIPKWEQILTLAVKVQYVTGIGYLGCDIVLDKEDGPLLLEMNVRAGLEVQVANMAPLRERLDRVEWVNINSPEKWVRLWRDLFSWDIEEKIKNISGKNVLGAREYVTLEYNEKTYKYIGEIQISQSVSYLDTEFASDVLQLSREEIESGKMKLKAVLLWENKNIKFKIKDLGDTKIILWNNCLKGFLIDPFKYRKWELPVSEDNDALKWKNTAIHKRYLDQLEQLDKDLINIDKKLVILSKITPHNLLAEKQKFIEAKGEYVPTFSYNKIELDFDEMLSNLEKIEVPDIPLSSIYARKKEEIKHKILFLKACGSQSIKDMNFHNEALFGDITDENLEYCRDKMSQKDQVVVESEFLSMQEIKDMINKFNHIYGIKIILQQWQRASRFVMKWEVLMVNSDAKVGKKEMRSIIAHEIEGHYLRKLNGRKMPYAMFGRGTAKYIEIDEGIATYNQSRFLTPKDSKYYRMFEWYYFVNYAANHSYEGLVKKLLEYYDNDYATAFEFIAKMKRWAEDVTSSYIFNKWVVYLNWYLKVDNFINTGGDLKELYLAKMTIEDLQDLKDSYFLKLNFNDLKVPFFL